MLFKKLNTFNFIAFSRFLMDYKPEVGQFQIHQCLNNPWLQVEIVSEDQFCEVVILLRDYTFIR